MNKHTVNTSIQLIMGILDLPASSDATIRITHLASLSSAEAGGLTFCTSRRKAELEHSKASAIILTDELADQYKGHAYTIRHRDPTAAFTVLMDALLQITPISKVTGIDPHASCDVSASIAPTARVSARAVIESGVVLEDDVFIGPGCFIGSNTIIQKGAKLHANVSVYHDCIIGERTQIHSGACIGVDGFGYVETARGLKKIPHVGRVVVGNDVEIGANSCVDRGMLDDTEIHDNVKLDNLVHIAHNVILGSNSAIAGQSAIAGSTTVGKNLRMGGKSGINGQIAITDNVIIGCATNILRTVKKSGFYIGSMPAQSQKNWARSAIQICKLGEKNQEKA